MRRHAFALLATGCAFLLPSSGGAASSLRIVTYGSSLTNSGGWQAAVTEELSKCSSKPVKILKIARGGANSSWGVQTIEAVVRAVPDAVVIEFSINDALVNNGGTLADQTRDTGLMIDRLRAGRPGVSIFLMTTNPVLGRKRINRPDVQSFYDNYVAIARERGVGVIDTSRNWDRIPPEQIPDGLHPDLDAYWAALVPDVAAALKPLACPAGR